MEESYYEKLETPVDWDKINYLGNEVFHNAKFELLDELTLELLPLMNLVYYQIMQQYDDRGYAKEDLIQDAILEIYRDMTLRWDKFISVENFYQYFKIIIKNVMLSLVQVYHNYYNTCEYDPDIRNDTFDDLKFSTLEAKIHKEYLESEIINLTRKICSNRTGYSKVLDFLITYKYIDKETDMAKFKNKVRSSGLSVKELNLLIDHVTYAHRLSYNYNLAKERGETAMIVRLDRILSRFEDSTYSVLSKNYGTTVLPEIYAEFGPALTKKFVKLFGDKTITIPNYQSFCDDLVGGSLLSLCNTRDDLYKIAAEYSLPFGKLVRIYDRATKMREEINK